MQNKKDTEPDTEGGLFERFIESAILFAVCGYLIKLGVCWIISVRIPLLIIAAIAVIITLIIRYIKWRNDHDRY